MQYVETSRVDRRTWRTAVVAFVLLLVLWSVAAGARTASGADVSDDGCNPNCVILIQVDGLEPKDVTQQTTPYLWSLAHPPPQGTPGLTDRSGWIWQAPRGVVSTGTAPATASLLTGAYPEHTGVPADDFYALKATTDTRLTRERLGAGGFGDSPVSDAGPDVAEPLDALPIDTPIGLLRDARKGVGVFLGDPGLAGLTGAAGAEAGPNWYPPGDAAEPQFTGDPRLCPTPRYPDGGTDVTQNQPTSQPPGFDPRTCPANDLTTTNKAVADLTKDGNEAIGFTFVHLAELGAARRLVDTSRPNPTDPSLAPPTPSEALSDADAAIGSLIEQYAQDKPDKWTKTVLMVVGSHGYQSTPVANRVPDPTAPSDATRDLSDFVANYAKSDASGPVVERGTLRLVPQGTMATIYFDPNRTVSASMRDKALQAIKQELEGDGLKAACASRNPAQPECVDDVHYIDRDTPGTADTVDVMHPTWHLDHRSGTGRTGTSGDLVISLGRGWAAGRAVGVPYQAVDGQPVTNPNNASSGGPQERAVAALINGPSQGTPGAVRNLDTFSGSQPGVSQVKYYPVSTSKVDPANVENPRPVTKCADDPAADPGGLACANNPAEVGDDTDDVGHEAQPVTVDFAITISALMRLPFESHPEQLQGRVLQEAFVSKLSTPCVSGCEPSPPPECFDVAALTQSDQPVSVYLSCVDADGAPLTYRTVSTPTHGTLGPPQGDGAVTYAPVAGFSGTDTFTYEATTSNGTSQVATATVIVSAPPVVERPRGFDFNGLVRGLKARVVDSRDRSYARAPRGSVLSTIHLEGDFGKPESAVTLTFYRRTAPRRGRVVRLKAIARFDPFVVKRGHVTMRLKVPRQFRPTYVGVTVREIALGANGRRRLSGGDPCSRRRTLRRVPFRCTGPNASAIRPIGDAARLHTRKGARRIAGRRR